MTQTSAPLSQEDVERLLQDPSADGRSEVAGRVGQSIESDLSAGERALAEQVLLMLARDAAVQVRAALAESIRHSAHVPREVALRLARDVDQVAFPLLRFSESLTDDDLSELVESTDDSGRDELAQRRTVSARLAERLIELGNEGTVVRLMQNEGAEIDEISFTRAVERFGAASNVPDAIAHRRLIPPRIAERLVQMVSDSVRQYLVSHHAMSPDVASDLILESRDRALKDLTGGDVARESAIALARRLHGNGTLTPALILRALCLGDTGFCEAGMSVLSGVPLINTQKLIHDAGGKGFEALYQRSGLPEPQLDLFRIAMQVADETDFDGEADAFERRRRRIIERILTFREGAAGEEIEYLVQKLESLEPEQHAAA
jgi:uncharacterized protein (DUF2336 family)